jgi:hypothetical protein
VLNWILTRLNRQSNDDLESARALVRAADRGERHIDPDKVRGLARALGLEVSSHAGASEVIDKMRRELARRGAL